MTKERKNSAQSPAAFASRFNTEIKTRNRERRSASRRLAATQAAAGSGRNDLLPPLELVDIRLDDLKLSQRRLRKRDPAHIREVANSIARLGYSKPILIGPDNEVIDGETVIEGVRLLGLDRLSCIRVGHLNDSERRLLRLAINRLAEKGEWDFEALRLEFNELILVDAPIEIGGFAPDEIDQILSSILTTASNAPRSRPRPARNPWPASATFTGSALTTSLAATPRTPPFCAVS